MDASQLAAMIDHTLLKPETTGQQISILCQEAVEFNFATICINPVWVKLAEAELRSSSVRVCAPVGFPLGASLSSIKAAEADQALSDGAEEIDMVMNIGALREGNLHVVEEDIVAVRQAVGKGLLKVIIEAAALNSEQIISASRIAMISGADYVKTSTGFHPSGGATVEQVKLIREAIGTRARIKAAGGIRNLATALSLIEAGADRLGTSSGVSIIQEMERPQQRPAQPSG
ncbi:MAG: deoxyribose-phosphate aldolase [Candidatus Dormibacteraceae bacterium]